MRVMSPKEELSLSSSSCSIIIYRFVCFVSFFWFGGDDLKSEGRLTPR